ncbi:MAG TPA: sulfotransferase [Rhizomicrobium sp.]|jgi:tetratricopeptide (TPR) repeat protein|nr:sulfotransferase [Rhizomicrobium sp.]
MPANAPATPHSSAVQAPDPFEAARQKLFPPLRNRQLIQATDALSDGCADVAKTLLARFLERRPEDPDALNLMADVARRGQRFEEAEKLMARCVAVAPLSAGYRFNYAVLLRRVERFEAALFELDQALALEPGNPLFREQKATLLRQVGRHDEALALRQGLTQDHPRSPEVWLQYGHVLRSVGLTGQCVAAYRKALELAPASAAAYINLADLKTFRFTAAETAAIEGLLTHPDISATERAELHFALGKAHSDENRHASAFENYAKGNALQRTGVTFDAAGLTAYRRECERLFTPEFLSSRNGWGTASTAPIFIVGMPRSGSTLIEQILSSHSAIEGLGELAELDSVVGRFLSREDAGRPAHDFWISGWLEFRKGLTEALHRVLPRLDPDEFRSLGQDYLEATLRLRSAKRPFFTDKGLRNFGHVGLIHLILPQAKLIDMRRHPLDCGWSIFRSHFPGGQPFSTRLADIGHHYANYVALMAHFDRVLPGRIHRIIYEDLVADPEKELRSLFAYLELPFEEECLRFHESRRTIRTISTAQVRTPLYASGVAQWTPYEQWLGPLKSALGAVLDHYPLAPPDV